MSYAWNLAAAKFACVSAKTEGESGGVDDDGIRVAMALTTAPTASMGSAVRDRVGVG